MNDVVAKAEDEVKTLASLAKKEAVAAAKSPFWAKLGGWISSGFKAARTFLAGVTRTEWLVVAVVVLLLWISLSPRHEPAAAPVTVAQCAKVEAPKKAPIVKRPKVVRKNSD